MTASTIETRYHRVKYLLFFAGLILDIALLFAFQMSGLSIELREWAAGWAAGRWAVNAVYFLIFAVGLFLIHLPVAWFREFYWEHRFDLSVERPAAWFADHLKKNLIGLTIFLVLLESIYFLLERFPESWWLGAGVVWLFLSVVLAKLMPHVIIPLFFKYSNVSDENLNARIRKLFERCGIDLEGVYVVDFSRKTKKANAFICGLGKRRRVVLSDTLLNSFSAEEIEAVVAHELAHDKHNDIVRMLAVNSVVVLASLYIAGRVLQTLLSRWGGLTIDDVAAFPVFVLVMTVMGFVTTPLLNAFSRHLEVAADRFCLRMTGRPQAFISMMEKLKQMNLAEENPGRWKEIFFYDHPPVTRRIEMARRFS